MGEQAGARRETHALEQAVDHPENAEDDRGGTKTKQEVDERREQQSRGHQGAGVASVSEEAISEFGEAIDHAMKRQKDSEALFRDSEILFEKRHRDIQVAANEIEDGIAEGGGEEDPRPPGVEGLFDPCRVGQRDGNNRSRSEEL